MTASPSAAQSQPAGATADVRDASGATIATAEFREGRGEVVVTLHFGTPGLLSGTHGLRVMNTGRCDAPAFVSAGDGFNPTGRSHGRQSLNGPQVGDLPNVNFTTGMTLYNTSVLGATLAAGPTSLLGSNGTALVLFANPDDQVTDPDGNAGPRVACGVITSTTAGPTALGLSGGAAVAVAVGGLLLIAGGFVMRAASARRGVAERAG
jgi:Cu-Zn family superoxide dismutase